jgi:hypothetical protein
MLKVILAPDVSSSHSTTITCRKTGADDQDPPEGFVQNYCLLIGDRSFSNFQKVITELPALLRSELTDRSST